MKRQILCLEPNQLIKGLKEKEMKAEITTKETEKPKMKSADFKLELYTAAICRMQGKKKATK